jgi:two-component system NarL family response regulator
MGEVRKAEVLLLDEQTLFRESLCHVVESVLGLRVMAQAGDCAKGVELASALRPDLVIIEPMSPGMSGIDCIHRLRWLSPALKILVLTAECDHRLATEVIEAGANGCIHKNCSIQELKAAIDQVCAHARYLSPEVRHEVDQALAGRSNRSSSDMSLSLRERQVLQVLVQGKSNRQVAGDLGIRVRTAEAHRRNIMKRLNVHTTVGLTKYALRHGLAAWT